MQLEKSFELAAAIDEGSSFFLKEPLTKYLPILFPCEGNVHMCMIFILRSVTILYVSL